MNSKNAWAILGIFSWEVLRGMWAFSLSEVRVVQDIGARTRWAKRRKVPLLRQLFTISTLFWSTGAAKRLSQNETFFAWANNDNWKRSHGKESPLRPFFFFCFETKKKENDKKNCKRNPPQNTQGLTTQKYLDSPAGNDFCWKGMCGAAFNSEFMVLYVLRCLVSVFSGQWLVLGGPEGTAGGFFYSLCWTIKAHW